ncbi:alpha/beta hydrolase family protein [Cognatilysobacter terrigena]|uniref:alpha/beta hydrolase family protein n=1 Tax=Cognatilysobacter terrigena TaxID=2488749 RepID=UPI00105EBA68|nr:prolyl oligopeptidase family serine peptidase [Lysobacter terrigena]
MGISARLRRTALQGFFFLLISFVCLAAHASRRIDAGEAPKLKPDEGLLVLAVDSDIDLEAVRFEREKSMWNGGSFRNLKKGYTLRLFAVPAGRYAWKRVVGQSFGYFTISFDLSNQPDYAFEVKPGRVNYVGDLVFRSTGAFTAQLRLANRSLVAMDWLESTHPAIAADPSLAFAYTGRYPDPFPDFYRQIRGTATATPKDTLTAPPAPATPLPLPPRELWKYDRVIDVAISPGGDVVVEATREGEKLWHLAAIDLATNKSILIATADMPFEDVQWESDRVLLANAHTPIGDVLHAFHFAAGTDGKPFNVRHVAVPTSGVVVDLLPEEPGMILYESVATDGLVVQRLRLDDDATVRAFLKGRYKDRLNVGVGRDLRWFADGHGRLRAALARDGEEDVALMYGADGVYRKVMRYDGESGFQPSRLSYEGDRFFGFLEDGRAQRDLVEMDPATGQIVRTVYSKPGIDLVHAIYDDKRVPIGVMYYREGRLVTEYFDERNERLVDVLRRAFPDRSVATLDRSRDAKRMLLWVDGIDQPPQVYLLDIETRQASLLDEMAPQLSKRRFAPAHLLKVKGSDGLPVDAFLTMPEVAGKRPLVVMAHGGPIGVQDDLHFNRDVQFLASLGYAVLQVNFRGSDGYGKAFREAGYRNYGRMIEDDIDAALRAALAAYPLDSDRMCTLGLSYGGYSAIVSTIRWPGRFRCAIDMSGVSDLPLFFTASDSSTAAKTREYMEKMIGNPNGPADLETMRQTSPLYRYQELTAPLMIVHGREDERVDYEHSRRLVRLLGMANRPPVVLAFEDEGHGLDKVEDLDKAWTGIAGFLARYLQPSALPAASPAASTSAAGH